jgi:hypothetical protein
MVAILSSTVVLWRFFAPFSVDEELERKLKAREENALVTILFIIFFGCALIWMMAVFGSLIYGWDMNFPTDGIHALAALSSFALTIIFSLLCKIKWDIGRQLGSSSVVMDGLFSFFGAAVSALLFIHSVYFDESLRWFENCTVVGVFGSQLSQPELIISLVGVLSRYFKRNVSKGICLFCCCCCATYTRQRTSTIIDASLNDVELGNVSDGSNDTDKEYEDSPNTTFDIAATNAPNEGTRSNLHQEK